MTRIHLDTDLGSDTDDLCALVMLLGWPGAELVGVTTSTDPGGQRAGFVSYALGLAGREDVPVVAGADGSLGGLALSPIIIPDYWPEPIAARRSPPGAAVDMLEASAESGAVMVAVGPYTNLAMLAAARPGLLKRAGTVVMGGHVTTPAEGFPRWGLRDDFNVQQDALAAKVVFEQCSPVIVPLAACLHVTLRSAHVGALRSAGPLGRLLADQGEMHARDNGMRDLGRAHPGLPDDLLNFHYDPLACAVALGWEGARIEEIPCALTLREGLLHMEQQADAPPMRVVTEVDEERFEQEWLEAVVRASGG